MEKYTHTQTSIYSKPSNIIQIHITYLSSQWGIHYYRIMHLLIRYYVPHLLIMYGYCTIVIYINSIVVLYLSLASSESSSSNGRGKPGSETTAVSSCRNSLHFVLARVLATRYGVLVLSLVVPWIQGRVQRVPPVRHPVVSSWFQLRRLENWHLYLPHKGQLVSH